MSPADADPHDDLVEVSASLRRFVGSRLRDAGDVDDVVQETLARMLAARPRLEASALTAYAFTVARNIVASSYRDADTARRYAPKLVDLREPPGPEQSALAAEERVALSAALDALPAEQRAALMAHAVDGAPLSQLDGGGTSPAAVAARLARTRARVRVDYLLALRRVALPTTRCRPVLLAVSAADVRRQRATSAGSHLLDCATCADLTPVLVRRERALAGVAPWAWLVAVPTTAARWVRAHPGPSVVGAAASSAAVAVALAVGGHAAPEPRASPAVTASTTPAAASPPTGTVSTATGSAARPPAALSALRHAGAAVVPDRTHLRALAGSTVTATAVTVISVPADEGFWVGEDAARRVWVQVATGTESPVVVRAGSRMSFSARVVLDGPGLAPGLGLGASDSRHLGAQRAHLVVRPADLRSAQAGTAASSTG